MENDESTEKLAQAQQLFNEISALKDRAEGLAKAAEAAKSKADSESGFAFNAKNNAEEHARTIAQIKGTVEADSNWLATTKSNATELSRAIEIAKTSADSDLQSIAIAKEVAQKDASSAAAARDSIDRIVTAVSDAQETVKQAAAAATQAKATIDATASSIQVAQTQINENATRAGVDATSIKALEADSKAIVADMSEISTTSKQTQSIITKHEADLADLKKKIDALRKTTESLLPGATSAGLASAFRDQKSRFDRPQRNWIWAFLIAVGLLFLAGAVGLPGFWLAGGAKESPSWDNIFRHFVNRLPLVVPLAWIAIYAGRNYMLALRMQEEYAFKEAISASFEGYRRETFAGQPSTYDLMR